MGLDRIDYGVSPAGRRRRSHQVIGGLVGAVAGGVVTPPAIFLAILSAGGGHGHYGFARLWFPYSMLLTRLCGDRIIDPLVWLAYGQFAAYGLAIGVAWGTGRRALLVVAASIVAVHAAAAAACFAGLLPNFS